jgi:hypothetical protein
LPPKNSLSSSIYISFTEVSLMIAYFFGLEEVPIRKKAEDEEYEAT